MADVNLIIAQLNIIGAAQYKGSPSSRKTFAEESFDRLKSTAGQVATILTQNPNPNGDQQENIGESFKAMKKGVESYCPKTPGTDDVLRAFNKASTEWDLLVKGL
jgi:hypothetical protein